MTCHSQNWSILVGHMILWLEEEGHKNTCTFLRLSRINEAIIKSLKVEVGRIVLRLQSEQCKQAWKREKGVVRVSETQRSARTLQKLPNHAYFSQCYVGFLNISPNILCQQGFLLWELFQVALLRWLTGNMQENAFANSLYEPWPTSSPSPKTREVYSLHELSYGDYRNSSPTVLLTSWLPYQLALSRITAELTNRVVKILRSINQTSYVLPNDAMKHRVKLICWLKLENDSMRALNGSNYPKDIALT